MSIERKVRCDHRSWAGLKMSVKEVRKICSSISTCLLKWRLASKEGKIILELINHKVFGDDDKNEEPSENVTPDINKKDFDEELNSNCNNLQDILGRMRDILTEIESVEEKSLGVSQLCDLSSSSSISPQKTNHSLLNSSNSQNSSLIELDNSVLNANDLTKWTRVISSSYRAQLKMNEIVSRNICHLESRAEALFHTSIWVCQPALNTECEAACLAVEQTLKSSQPQ